MRVTELARAGSVKAETVRHYTREGLLRPRRDPCNGYQLYDIEALGRLRFIDFLRSLGVSLSEIRRILSCADQDGTSIDEAYLPLAEQGPRIRLRIQELQAIAWWLDNGKQRNASNAPSLGQLIETLGSTESIIDTGGSHNGHQ